VLGEHIEAKKQAEEARRVLPVSQAEIEEMRETLSEVTDLVSDDEFLRIPPAGRAGIHPGRSR
jgi:hypothetical protein